MPSVSLSSIFNGAHLLDPITARRLLDYDTRPTTRSPYYYRKIIPTPYNTSRCHQPQIRWSQVVAMRLLFVLLLASPTLVMGFGYAYNDDFAAGPVRCDDGGVLIKATADCVALSSKLPELKLDCAGSYCYSRGCHLVFLGSRMSSSICREAAATLNLKLNVDAILTKDGYGFRCGLAGVALCTPPETCGIVAEKMNAVYFPAQCAANQYRDTHNLCQPCWNVDCGPSSTNTRIPLPFTTKNPNWRNDYMARQTTHDTTTTSQYLEPQGFNGTRRGVCTEQAVPGGNTSTEAFGPTSAAGNNTGGNNTVHLPDVSGDSSDPSTELPIGLGAGVLFAVCSFGACYAVRKRRQRRQGAHTFEKPDELYVGNPTFEINNPAFDSSSSATQKSSGTVSTASLSPNHPAAGQLMKMEEDVYTLEAKSNLRTSTHGLFLILRSH